MSLLIALHGLFFGIIVLVSIVITIEQPKPKAPEAEKQNTESLHKNKNHVQQISLCHDVIFYDKSPLIFIQLPK